MYHSLLLCAHIDHFINIFTIFLHSFGRELQTKWKCRYVVCCLVFGGGIAITMLILSVGIPQVDMALDHAYISIMSRIMIRVYFPFPAPPTLSSRRGNIFFADPLICMPSNQKKTSCMYMYINDRKYATNTEGKVRWSYWINWWCLMSKV